MGDLSGERSGDELYRTPRIPDNIRFREGGGTHSVWLQYHRYGSRMKADIRCTDEEYSMVEIFYFLTRNRFWGDQNEGDVFTSERPELNPLLTDFERAEPLATVDQPNRGSEHETLSRFPHIIRFSRGTTLQGAYATRTYEFRFAPSGMLAYAKYTEPLKPEIMFSVSDLYDNRLGNPYDAIQSPEDMFMLLNAVESMYPILMHYGFRQEALDFVLSMARHLHAKATGDSLEPDRRMITVSNGDQVIELGPSSNTLRSIAHIFYAATSMCRIKRSEKQGKK